MNANKAGVNVVHAKRLNSLSGKTKYYDVVTFVFDDIFCYAKSVEHKGQGEFKVSCVRILAKTGRRKLNELLIKGFKRTRNDYAEE